MSIPLREEFLFISDLHLSWDKPEITRRFLDFLKQRAANSKALFILGDLFDAWVGDDDYSPPNRQIRQALRALADSGTEVYLQLGNRDFLIGSSFCEESGVKLLSDYHVLDLFGTPTLLTHGDLLCTDDVAYQVFRKKSRTEEWQRNVLNKPLFLRILAGRWYRLRSYFHKRKKSQEIMDVNSTTVAETMVQHNCLRLIHGHTHRPHIHDLTVGGQPAQRFVLSAWSKESGEVLSWTRAGYKIEKI